MSYVLINDEFIPREAAHVDIEDRGYQFGDGIYEVVAVYGNKPFKMDEHLTRLARSAKEIGLILPCRMDRLKDNLLKLNALDPIQDGMIYFQITRGTAPRNHSFPQPSVPAQLTAYTKRIAVLPINLLQEEGVHCLLVEDIRWLRCDIKSLNLLGNVMAKQKAIESGAYEAILHRGEIVTEGSSTNIFMVKDEIVYTHPTNSFILNGITRMTIADICKNLNVNFVEEAFSTEALLEADEVFMSGTTSGIIPVIHIDMKRIGNGTPGMVTVAILREFKLLLQGL